MWETWVPSLGWEDPLEESMTAHASILAWRIPMDRGAWWNTVHAITVGGLQSMQSQSDTTERLSTQHICQSQSPNLSLWVAPVVTYQVRLFLSYHKNPLGNS